MFGFIRQARRRKLFHRPVPAAWLGYLERNVAFFRELGAPERDRLLGFAHIFLAEKNFIGAHGAGVTEEMKVVIAAAAARLVLDLDISYYDRLTEIIVYPSGFMRPDDDEGALDGEAHDWGVVVLAWDAVLDGLADAHDGQNTVFHEFAHVLDRASGSFDGTPVLRGRGDYDAWAEVMSAEYLRLQRMEGTGRYPLDDYAAENEAEFFAVATEVFFEDPDRLRSAAPAMYREMARFYRGASGTAASGGAV